MISFFKEPHCVWYGECGPGDSGQAINCYYDGPPKLMTNQTALSLLESACGMVYNGKRDQKIDLIFILLLLRLMENRISVHLLRFE